MKNPTNSIFMLTAALSLVVVASTSQATSSEREIKLASVERGIAATKFGNKKSTQRRASKTYLGKAPYICSPSGFGRTSSCKLRVSYSATPVSLGGPFSFFKNTSEKFGK